MMFMQSEGTFYKFRNSEGNTNEGLKVHPINCQI